MTAGRFRLLEKSARAGLQSNTTLTWRDTRLWMVVGGDARIEWVAGAVNHFHAVDQTLLTFTGGDYY